MKHVRRASRTESFLHLHFWADPENQRDQATREGGGGGEGGERGEEGELKALAASKKHPVTLMFDRTAQVTCPLIIYI